MKRVFSKKKKNTIKWEDIIEKMNFCKIKEREKKWILII